MVARRETQKSNGQQQDVLPYVSPLAAATNSSGLKLATPGNPSPSNCPFAPSYFRLAFVFSSWPVTYIPTRMV